MPFLFSITLFLSAALLFCIQPLVAKLLLPQLGGTPAVWNTCMVFFQVLLLAGYAYAHAATAWLGVRRQILLHLPLLLLPATALPIALHAEAIQTLHPDSNPIPWLLTTLTVMAGLPFFVVSTSGPLLQKWFAETGHSTAGDPYFLYAASNLGSMLGLLGYPLLFEPSLTLKAQGEWWAVGYAVLAVLTLSCAAVTWRSFAPRSYVQGVAVTTDSAAPLHDRPMTSGRRLRWVALAAVPSSLMLGLTTYITTDIAAVPLFWTVPLALYLLSFILVFARLPVWLDKLILLFCLGIVCWAGSRFLDANQHYWGLSGQTWRLVLLGLPLAGLALLHPRVPRLLYKGMVWSLPVLVVCLVIQLNTQALEPIGPILLVHLATFFAAAMVCHGQLAEDRPDPRYLTEFYLWLSVGGALGGMFNALVAPVLFNPAAWGTVFQTVGIPAEAATPLAFHRIVEYPLALVLLCLLRPRISQPGPVWRRVLFDYVAPTALGILALALVLNKIPLQFWIGSYHVNLQIGWREQLVVYYLPAAVCLLLWDRRVGFALGIAAVLLASACSVLTGHPTLYVERNFFGVLRVIDFQQGRYHELIHGSTMHGMQCREPGRTREPMAYFHRTGPLGEVFRVLEAKRIPAKVGILGLGTGGITAYAQPGQEWTYYEIDPAIERVARNPRTFSFLSECPAWVEVKLGDGRLRLRDAPARHYDLLIMDAFSSDAIPMHLITREAVQLYLDKLAEGGILLFNISNRYLQLQAVLGALAADAGLYALWRNYHPDEVEDEDDRGRLERSSSTWFIMARDPKDLGDIASDERWQEPPPASGAVWTDDFSNLLSVMTWQ